MYSPIKNASVFLLVLYTSMNVSFSQEVISIKPKFDKYITTGISSAVPIYFFLNALPNVGFQMYNNHSNLGFTFNSEFLIRFRVENFMVLLTYIGAYKKINHNGKHPVDVGISLGAGINSVNYTTFLTSAFVSIPVWKLNLKCQPTLVVPSFKSSFINLSLIYNFKLQHG
jgi:hypothetical protein